MTHFTADEFVDAVEGTLPAARLEHLRACGTCREEVAQVASAWREVERLTVPEPSPLFWDHLSARVRRAIDSEPPPSPRWFAWPVLAPLTGVAALVLALVTLVPQDTSEWGRLQIGTGEPALADELAAADADDRWATFFELVGDLDIDTAAEAGIAGRPGAADSAVLYLTSAERQELVRLLRAELR